MSAATDLYGWYSSADQADEKPDRDPPHDAPCPYCGDPLSADDVRTHSFAAVASEDRDRCYFYRTHRTCDTAATEAEKQSIFGAVIKRITVEQGVRP